MTLIQRIHDLCVAIGNDLKTLKKAVDKNTAVNDVQDKNIKELADKISSNQDTTNYLQNYLSERGEI